MSLDILELGPPKTVTDVIRGGIELNAVDDDREPMSDCVLSTLESYRGVKTLTRGLATILRPNIGNCFYLRVTHARPPHLPINL